MGELLFPSIVLGFVVLYYVGTRGLPDRSLLYAGPLMYVTVVLAVITVLQHAIVFGRPNDPMTDGGEVNEVKTDMTSGQTPHEQFDDEQLQNEPASSDSDPYFNRKTASLYVVVTTVYILGLTVFSSFLTTPVFIGLTAAFLGTTLAVFGERQVLRLIVYSVGFSLLIWAVFISWLEVPVI